ADLYVSAGHRQAGAVLVGDAFETTCPVTGTGSDKVFTDVERLCNVHIPAWLAIDGGIYWRAQRWARFLAWLGRGRLRRLRRRLSAAREVRGQSSSSSSSLS